MRRLLLIAFALVITLCAFASAQDAPDYGDTYTPEELAALDQALWAGNMTRADMHFKKDYTDGKGCFPIVHEMMDDPLSIAPWMDQMAGLDSTGRSQLINHVIRAAETCYGQDHVMPYSEWASSSEWNWLLENDDASWSAEDFIAYVETDYCLAAEDENAEFPLDEMILSLPTYLAWHDVFSSPKRLGPDEVDQIKQFIADQSGDWWAEQLVNDPYYNTSGSAVDYLLFSAGFPEYAKQLPPDFFPQDEPLIHQAYCGTVVIGTPNDDEYSDLEIALLIEPGGNDTYTNCQIAGVSDTNQRMYGLAIDLGGDDFYDCADVDITLGAAVLGVAAFYDLGGGNDRYYAGFCSLGAAMGGVATFYDDGGCDYYSGKAFTQGAAGFGVGIMLDDSLTEAPVFDTAEGNEGVIDSYETGESENDVHTQMDNDYYTAWEGAQAFARPRGVALCINRRGNEVYHAGGVYLHAPLFADRYHSFSQGFAIGERGEDWAGGIAMLIDYDGNDRYLGDIYSQGVGYWYGAGLLWDGGGNDTYEMTQYGQGSGIHLAVGGLVDCAGSDTYVMHAGLGQGGSHDLAASILHDRGGDDHYMGTTTCNGAALTGSVGIHIDRSGNDIYAGRANNGVNHTDGRAHNVGVLVDMDGDDEYLGIQDDGLATLMRNLSMSLDTAPPPPPEAEGDEDAAQDSDEGADVPLPEVISYEGDLTQEVFDELWEIACRWEVGDNREIVPKARERLVKFGPEMLALLEPEMNEDYSLNIRAYVGVLKPMYEGEYAADVAALLMRQAQIEDEARNNVALYVIGELKVAEAESIVAQFVANSSGSIQRRAMGVLASLGSHAADEQLLSLLLSSDEPQLKSALAAIISLKLDCYPELQPLLSHPLVSVRELLVEKLAGNWDTYSEMILADLESEVGQTDVRKVRSIMHILAKLSDPPTARQVLDTAAFLQSDDWGLQGDCIRLFKQWSRLEDVPMDVSAELDAMRNSIKTIDVESAHPYVRYWLEKE